MPYLLKFGSWVVATYSLVIDNLKVISNVFIQLVLVVCVDANNIHFFINYFEITVVVNIDFQTIKRVIKVARWCLDMQL